MKLLHSLIPALALVASACGSMSHYTAPGRGADLQKIAPQASSDPEIQGALERKPAAGWPATIATVRVQAAGYSSESWSPKSRGGAWTVVGVREVEKPEHLARLRALPQVRDVGVASSLIFPEQIHDDADLRSAAARMQADLLLVYTLDTAVRETNRNAFLALITLGLAHTHLESVTSTAQCVLLDVRTGFYYGSAEATERVSRKQSELESELFDERGFDHERLRIESKAFEKLVTAFEGAWPEIVARHATPSP